MSMTISGGKRNRRYLMCRHVLITSERATRHRMAAGPGRLYKTLANAGANNHRTSATIRDCTPCAVSMRTAYDPEGA